MTSLLRRPLTKEASRRLAIRFVEKAIELARHGVGIHAAVPSLLLARAKPLDDAPVFFGGKAVDSGFDLFNSAHAWSLAPSRAGNQRSRPHC